VRQTFSSTFSTIFRLERSAVIVKRFTCGLSVLVVALGLAIVPGCGADNESDATKPNPDLKAPGPPAKTAEDLPTPKTMEDYAKNRESANAATTAVPGAPKATPKK
jgi:hypothetical protein